MRCVVGAMMVIFLLGGVGLFWHGLQSLFQVIRRRPHLVPVNGVVLRVERKIQNIGTPRRRRRGSNIANYPIIQFQNQAGEVVSFRSEVGDMGEQSSYRQGQTLPVLYDPEGHITPMINSWSGLWFPAVGITIAGLVFIGGGVLIWVAYGERILGG